MNNSLRQLDTTQHISIGELVKVLYLRKKLILAFTSVLSLCSYILLSQMPDQYSATVVLAPAKKETNDLSGALGQFGGLAPLAGISFGRGETTESQIAQEIMKSWSFIDKFIQVHKIAPEIYAARRWSKSKNDLQFDDRLYDTTRHEWLIMNPQTGELGPPSSWKLYKSFKNKLTVVENTKTGLVRVTIEYFSPYLAKQWLDTFIADINFHMQARQVERVTRNIDYLRAEIQKTSVAEMREVFFTIIEEQMKAKMLAQASPEYVFVTVSPVMIPESTSSPKRLLIMMIVVLFGLIISGAYSLISSSLKK